MRYTSSLLMALASATAMAQNNGTATSSGPPQPTSGTPAGAAAVDLSGAQLGEGAEFITLPDGSQAIQLSPGANGEATFSLGTPVLPPGVSVGDLIQLIFDIFVQAESSGATRKRAPTDCTLDVTVNGEPVFSSGLETTEGFDQQTSSSTEAAEEQDIVFTNACGDTPATLQVANLAVGPAEDDNGGSSSSDGPIATPPATSSNPNNQTTATSTGPIETGTDTPGFPSQIGDWALFGCVGSTANFPTFTLAQSSASNDLNACADLCDGRAFFGTYDNNCYCGDSINPDNTNKVELDLCDIECPGDAGEFCGGDRLLNRRQAISNSILLTVYIFIGGVEPVTTTATTTFTTTVTGASTTETRTVTAVVECVNDVCYPDGGPVVVILKPYPGADCEGQNVWVIEDCSCKGGHQYVPKYCNGDCNGKTVYKPEEVKDFYNHDVVYTPTDVKGKTVYKPWEDNYGTPEKPNVSELPPPAPPAAPPATPPSSGGDTPEVIVSSAGKQAFSGLVYVAAVLAAFL